MTNLGFWYFQVRFQMAGKRNKFATKHFCPSKCVWSFSCVISVNTKGVNIRMYGNVFVCWNDCCLVLSFLLNVHNHLVFKIILSWKFHFANYASRGTSVLSVFLRKIPSGSFDSVSDMLIWRVIHLHPQPPPLLRIGVITQDWCNHQELGMSGLSFRQLNAGAGLSN